jgi:hypothetical protein
MAEEPLVHQVQVLRAEQQQQPVAQALQVAQEINGLLGQHPLLVLLELEVTLHQLPVVAVVAVDITVAQVVHGQAEAADLRGQTL